ncbi:MAG: hypothetical protein RL742_1833 [Bacteroidota bacterium]
MFINPKFLSLILFLTVGLFVGCVKQEFDQPDPCGDGVVNISANTTIKALKALRVTPGGYDKITEDLIIAGTVVMDDRSGNYYKSLVIQDSTGGIEVRFNDGFLSTQFPVGRTLYIRCKDLYLGEYSDLIQLTGGLIEEGGAISDVGLTDYQVRTKIVKDGICDIVAPVGKIVRIADITDDLISTLITLENVEFIKADTSKTYADPVTQNSLNRTFRDCQGQQMLLRTSGYADFAAALTPRGNGTITGVLGIYNGTYQLYIRDLNDVQMAGDRCGSAGPNGFANLEETFTGTTNNTDIDLAGWINVALAGNRIWRGAFFSGNRFASATAFNSSLANMETWLITPALDLRAPKTLTFETSSGYYRHDGLTVLVSTNFDGQNIAAATWTELSFAKPVADPNGYSNFAPSGNIALPVAGTKGYVAFKYTGNTTTNTTTWRIDNVKVQ